LVHGRNALHPCYRETLLPAGLLTAILPAFAGPALLKAQSFTGGVTGLVTDPSGAAVPNTKLTAAEESSHLVTATQSDVRGGYAFPSLRPGTYRIHAEAA